MKFVKNINKHLHTPFWLFILLIVVLILRIPSLFEPYSYGDEMIYMTLGEAIRKGVPLYKEIHDNKPPLLYLTAGIAGSLFWFKVILAIWHSVTIFIFWKFVERLFPNKTTLHKLSTAIFAILTTIPLFEGNIANAELFMIGPIILAFYLLWPGKEKESKIMIKRSLTAGALFAIATLYKVPGAFDLPAIIFLWLIAFKFNLKNLKILSINTFFIGVGFVVPIAFTFLIFWMQDALPEYAIAAFLQNFGYLSSWRPDDVKEPFLTKNGPLLIRSGIVTFGFFILWLSRNKVSRQFIFLTAWLLLTLFSVALSERPYPHYIIQSLAPMSIMIAILVTFETIEQALVIIPLTLAFYIPVHYHFWHYETLSYYQRFIDYTKGSINQTEYMESFGGSTVRNYAVSEFLVKNSRSDDPIFVWGNSSTIYALSRRLPPIRYVADYHISDFYSREAVINELKKTHPKFIVILPNSQDFSELDNFVKSRYGFVDNVEGAEIWIYLSLKENYR